MAVFKIKLQFQILIMFKIQLKKKKKKNVQKKKNTLETNAIKNMIITIIVYVLIHYMNVTRKKNRLCFS